MNQNSAVNFYSHTFSNRHDSCLSTFFLIDLVFHDLRRFFFLFFSFFFVFSYSCYLVECCHEYACNRTTKKYSIVKKEWAVFFCSIIYVSSLSEEDTQIELFYHVLFRVRYSAFMKQNWMTSNEKQLSAFHYRFNICHH